MTVTIALGGWMIPAALTVLLLGYLIFFQDLPERRNGPLDLVSKAADHAAGIIAKMIIGAYAFAITLIWLAYFIWLAAVS